LSIDKHRSKQPNPKHMCAYFLFTFLTLIINNQNINSLQGSFKNWERWYRCSRNKSNVLIQTWMRPCIMWTKATTNLWSITTQWQETVSACMFTHVSSMHVWVYACLCALLVYINTRARIYKHTWTWRGTCESCGFFTFYTCTHRNPEHACAYLCLRSYTYTNAYMQKLHASTPSTYLYMLCLQEHWWPRSLLCFSSPWSCSSSSEHNQTSACISTHHVTTIVISMLIISNITLGHFEHTREQHGTSSQLRLSCHQTCYVCIHV
jgi:hypothetical protein